MGAPVSETERMSQTQLPIFPAGLKEISNHIAIQCEADQVVYFNGHLPVFQHAAADVQGFRLSTSQLIVQGTVSQSEIVQAFGGKGRLKAGCSQDWLPHNLGGMVFGIKKYAAD